MLLTVPYKAIPHLKWKRINFPKKIRSQETHNIPQKINKTFFLHNIF